MIRPTRLAPGDKIAAVCLSWGGAGAVPARYARGKEQILREFGLHVVEMEHTCADPDWLRKNPAARAADFMQAFRDPSIKGIFSVIGGDDSIRLLPYIDPEVIRNNPKVFVGYSDSTVSHLACYSAGLTSFYGPSILSGFAENCGMHSFLANSFRVEVMSRPSVRELVPNHDGWTVEMIPWDEPARLDERRTLQPSSGWHWLQGEETVSGLLFGGCLEVLDWLRGSTVWPLRSSWDDTVLFLETSEEAPSVEQVERMLRALCAALPTEKLRGVLFGRPGGPIATDRFFEYYLAVQRIINGELGLTRLPIVCGVDIGHTDPFLTLPYGVRVAIDCTERSVKLLEAGVS